MLREAGRIEGRVVDARNRGVGGVYVAAFQGEQAEQSGLTDERGEFTLRDVLGNITVRVQPEGREPLVCEIVDVRARVSRIATCPSRVSCSGCRCAWWTTTDSASKVRSSSLRREGIEASLHPGESARRAPAAARAACPSIRAQVRARRLPAARRDEAVEHAEQEVRVTLRKAAKLERHRRGLHRTSGARGLREYRRRRGHRRDR